MFLPSFVITEMVAATRIRQQRQLSKQQNAMADSVPVNFQRSLSTRSASPVSAADISSHASAGRTRITLTTESRSDFMLQAGVRDSLHRLRTRCWLAGCAT